MTISSRFSWALDDGISDRLVLVQGTGPQGIPGERVPAIDLYEEGTIPRLRARLGQSAPHRARVRFLSNMYGLVPADQPVNSGPVLPLSEKVAAWLRPKFKADLWAEFTRDGAPREVLIMADAAHSLLVTDVETMPDHQAEIHPFTIQPERWYLVADVLDKWGWP